MRTAGASSRRTSPSARTTNRPMSWRARYRTSASPRPPRTSILAGSSSSPSSRRRRAARSVASSSGSARRPEPSAPGPPRPRWRRLLLPDDHGKGDGPAPYDRDLVLPVRPDPLHALRRKREIGLGEEPAARPRGHGPYRKRTLRRLRPRRRGLRRGRAGPAAPRRQVRDQTRQPLQLEADSAARGSGSRRLTTETQRPLQPG